MLRISVLGEQSIVDATTGAVRSRSPRTLALVARLVAHAGSPQPRPRLAALFWPDSTDAQALTNLRRELHTLRHALAGEPCLVATVQDLCWQDAGAVRVDLRVFDQEHAAARRAAAAGESDAVAAHADAGLAAYRGDLLPGVDDEWVLEARARCQDRAVELCALACATRADRGEPGAAVGAARLWIRLRPLEEAGYRALMRLQAALGDRAAALATYHRCASVLERELGVQPDEATRAMFRGLLAEPAQPGVGAATGASAFVGRRGELAALRAAWERAAAGSPGVVLVRGGAGVGKSRLVAELVAAARRRGAVTATARCFATAGRLPLAPVAEWLRSPDVAPAVAALDPVWRDEVHRLVPAGPEHGGPTPAGSPTADAWQRHRFYEGLARALLGAGRPTLLVLDDLQWCDQETLTFLSFCLALVADAPVLVAATLRSDGPVDEPEPAGWIRRLQAAGLLTDIALGPLDGAETARLAEAVRGAPLAEPDRALLAAVTGGFPLHVVEAVRAVGRGSLPAGDLDAVLRSRLAQAGPVAQEVAELAAAVGRDVTLDLLVAAGDLDADAAVAAVDELWRLRILREHGDGYDFSHDLLRDAAYACITPARRWLLHRRVAQGLETLHADDVGPVAAQLAEQYARGGRSDLALAHYRRAAQVAEGVFAHGEAIRLHAAALAIVRARPPGRSRDADELAVLEAMAAPLNARHGYASVELQPVLERSVELAEALDRRTALVDGLVGLFASRFVQGRIVEAHDVAARALGLVEPGTETAAAAHFAFAGSAMSLGHLDESVRHFGLMREFTGGMLLSVGTRIEVHGRGWGSHAVWLSGDDAGAQAMVAEAVRRARALDHPYSLAVALAYVAVLCQFRGDRAALPRATGELRALCGRHGFGYYGEWGLVLDGWHRGGEAGVALARHGIERLVRAGALSRRPYWLALVAALLDEVGDHDGARATLDDAAEDARARDDVWWLPEVLRMRAAYDRPDRAVARLHAAADLAAAHGSRALLARCRDDLAARGVRRDG